MMIHEGKLESVFFTAVNKELNHHLRDTTWFIFESIKGVNQMTEY